jgi:hypothetical protein
MNIKPLIGIGILGAGAYFILSKGAGTQAQQFIEELPSGNRGVTGGIGTGDGLMLSTAGAPTTPTQGDTYNTTYVFESPNIDFQPATLDQQQPLTKKETTAINTQGYTSETLQMSFGTLEAKQKAEAEAQATAPKKTTSGSSYFNLPTTSTSSYFNIPAQYTPSTQATSPATTTAPKKEATAPTINTAQAQAITLIPTAIVNPIGAVAQATSYAVGNWFSSIFGGR